MLSCHPWLPALQTCTDGTSCKRRVCFFAHTDAQLRKPEADSVLLSQQLQAELAAGMPLLHAKLLSWVQGGWKLGQSHLNSTAVLSALLPPACLIAMPVLQILLLSVVNLTQCSCYSGLRLKACSIAEHSLHGQLHSLCSAECCCALLPLCLAFNCCVW